MKEKIQSELSKDKSQDKDGSGDNSEEVNFKEQLIGYIRDEMHQGFSLKQINESLIEQGYDKEEVDFVIAYVKTRFHVSDRNHNKERKKRTDEHHLKLRFYGPVAGILLLTVALIAGVFTFDGAQEQQELKFQELLPYYRLNLDPDSSSITSSKIIVKRAEPVDSRRAQALIDSKKGNVLFDNIQPIDVTQGFHKKATVYTITEDGAVEYKTLVELTTRPVAATKTLKILEVIPKDILKDASSITMQGGLIIEADPILQWTFSDVKQDQPIMIRYIINRQLANFESFTYTMTQKDIQVRGPTQCGNGLCEVGESYLLCCLDCGCLPGFDCNENKCVAKPKDQCQIDSQCDDFDISTKDTCAGTPKTCQHTTITECRHGDNFCPSGCVYDIDVDCPPPEVFSKVIDNQMFVLNKSLPPWDPAFRCAEDWWCTDGDECTSDHCDMDNNVCYWMEIKECADDDQCCPAGCSPIDDNDCN